MSLDISLTAKRVTEVYSGNITHNLNEMAMAAGIYKHIWRPEEVGAQNAGDLIDPLTEALDALRKNPSKFKKFNSPNGWGKYENFVAFVQRYLDACVANPDAVIGVCR